MGNSTKLHYKILPQWFDPEFVFDVLFANEKYSFWLDSSLTNKNNRFSYMGASPEEIYSYFLKNSRTVVQKKNIETYSTDIFTFLDSRLKQSIKVETKLPFDFAGGFIGYFGYEMKALTDGKVVHTSPYPDSLWFLVNKFVAFDHHKKKVYLVCLAKNKKEADEWSEKITSQLKTFKKTSTGRHSGDPPAGGDSRIDSGQERMTSIEITSRKLEGNMKYTFSRSKQQYLKDIKRCKEFLEKGESYQICLTNTITTKAEIEPLVLYKMLRVINPAPYAAYIQYNNLAILSSSPEQFLKIARDRTVQTKPIKGTMKRGQTRAEDKKLKQQLATSKKDWSENAMIVDLLRNDLGKVCEFGSVKVTKSMDVESYQTIHQLVSTINGKLRDTVSIIDCIKACFPGGSMTGAPKIRTMEILDELEKKPRGIYSGALGFLSFNGTAELSIVIRTIIANKNTLSIGTGGAILIDSDPQKEYEEMLLKSNALLETIKKVYTTRMHTVFLALGSNVGDKKKHIKKAVATLKKHLSDIKVAKLYKTKPMYYEDQDMFVNTVVKGQTLLSPLELFAFVKHAEWEVGRQERFHNGPREIDIDILFYNQLIYESEELIIPHPRISEREFVLQPFADLDPDFVHPVLNKTINELLTALKEKGK